MKGRNWCFTDNTTTLIWDELPAGVKFFIAQLEIAPTTGQKHIQGYVQLSRQQRLSWLKKLRPGAHWEVAKGSADENIRYCSKSDSRAPNTEPVRRGEPKRQGKRSDLLSFVKEVRGGKRRRELLESHASVFARHRHFYDTVKMTYEPKKQGREVILLFGAPGTGKTHNVRTTHKGRLYVAPLGDHLWMDHYDDEDVVCLDDFSGQLPLRDLLRLLHDWPERVPVKGSHCWFNPKMIYITSNIKPKYWYKWKGREVQAKALRRRFKSVLHYTEKGKDPKVLSDAQIDDLFKPEDSLFVPVQDE